MGHAPGEVGELVEHLGLAGIRLAALAVAEAPAGQARVGIVTVEVHPELHGVARFVLVGDVFGAAARDHARLQWALALDRAARAAEYDSQRKEQVPPVGSPRLVAGVGEL